MALNVVMQIYKWLNSRKKTVLFLTPQFCLLTLYFTELARGGMFSGHFVGNSDVMQSLDGNTLAKDLKGSLQGMHTQPPLLNLIFAVSILVDENHALLIIQILWLIIAQLGVFFLTLGIKTISNNWILSLFLSTLYVCIPGTVMYSLWSYNTILVQSFTIIFLSSFIRILMRKTQMISFFCLLASSIILYLMRVPFNFVLTILIIILSWFMLERTLRSRKSAIISAFISVAFILGVQSHYYFNFGLLSTSSWTYDQSLRVLQKGLNDYELEKISSVNPCFAQIIELGPWQPINLRDKCDINDENVANNDFFAISEEANVLNSRNRLLGSLALEEFLRYTAFNYPQAYVRTIFGSNQFEGTLFVYLGFKNYPKDTAKALVYNIIPILFFLSLLFLFFMLLTKRVFIFRELKILIVPLALTLFMNIYALLGEVVENERIRSDSHAVTFFTAVLLFIQSKRISQRCKLDVMQ